MTPAEAQAHDAIANGLCTKYPQRPPLDNACKRTGMKSYAYWGKVVDGDDTVCHRLVYHSLDVAAVAERLIHCDARWGASVMRAVGQRNAQGLAPFLVALHDMGKCPACFRL